MLHLNDVIPALPETIANGPLGEVTMRKATVVYIHPEGRYYILRFDCKGGSFCESRFFSEAEKKAGWKTGLFRRIPLGKFSLDAPTLPLSGGSA